MELALTLASIASFFALVLAWTVLPATGADARETAQPTVPSTQTAH